MKHLLPKIALATATLAAASLLYAQTPAGPSLEVTVQWLQSKIEAYAGGVQLNTDTGLKDIAYGTERFTKTIERSNVHAAYGPNVCQFQYSWHKDYHWTREAHQANDKLDEDDDVGTDVIINFAFYDLKQATVAYNSGYGSKVLTLAFNGKKAVAHVHGKQSFTWSQNRNDDYCDYRLSTGYAMHSDECTVSPSQSADKYGNFPINTDTAEEVEYLPFQRDTTQDNEELANRAAAALNHLRDVCMAQRPASSEPF